MHTIYDVVDASVNQSCHNKSKTLRVKLTVTPEPRSHRRETGAGRWHQHYNLDYRCNNTLNYIITIIIIRIISATEATNVASVSRVTMQTLTAPGL